MGGCDGQIAYVEQLRGRGVTFAATDAETLLRALPSVANGDDARLPPRLRKEMRDDHSEPWQRAATFQQLRLEAYLVTSPTVRPSREKTGWMGPPPGCS